MTIILHWKKLHIFIPRLLLKCEMMFSRIENAVNYADMLKTNHRNSFTSFRWEILFIYVFLVEFQKLISLENLKLITKKDFFAKVKVPWISVYIFFCIFLWELRMEISKSRNLEYISLRLFGKQSIPHTCAEVILTPANYLKYKFFYKD